MSRWSPIRMVFSIEALGITRAWPSVPSIKMNARITQTQESTSRQKRARRFASFSAFFSSISAFTLDLDFQLHQLGWIVCRVAGGAEFSVRIAAGLAHQADDFAAGCAAHDRIVHQHDAFAFEQAAHRIQFQLHAEVADCLHRLDERAADVMVADQAEAKRDAGLLRVADCRGYARIRHRHDQVSRGGMLAREQAAEPLTAFVHLAAEDDAVRPRKINVLKN